MFTKITGTILNYIFIVGKMKLPSDQIFSFFKNTVVQITYSSDQVYRLWKDAKTTLDRN